MESSSGDKRRALTRALKKNPTAFDFFEVVRRIDSIAPESPRTGWGSSIEDESIRFGQEPSLAFPPTSISSFNDSGRVPLLSVNFLGLLGSNGPMPLHFTEYVRDRSHNNLDPTWQRFLDIFHNRAVALFYRAWAVNEQATSYDRPEEDWFCDAVSSLIGETPYSSCSSSDPILDHARCYWASHMIATARNADGLASMLSDFFEMDVNLSEYLPCWMDIPKQYYCICGGSKDNATLGVNIFLGAKQLVASEKFGIMLGPLSREDFERMLPGGRSFKRLVTLVDSYLTKPLLWELRMTLKREEIPQTVLGSYGKLGYTTWIKSLEAKDDDTSFRLNLGDRLKGT